MSKHKVQWIDGRRAPQCAPNPSYPLGIALNAAGGAGGRPDDPRSITIACKLEGAA